MLGLDTETTGLDLQHGCRPFLVTICDEAGMNTCWEWRVDPKTRRVRPKREELLEIQEELDRANGLVLQNAKFDFGGLNLLFKDNGLELWWDWDKTHDTLYSGHLLASNQPHDLATMALVYLRINIKRLEDRLATAMKEARSVAEDKYPNWRIAKKGIPEIPSVKSKVWKCDYWLPKTIARFQKYDSDHPWWTITEEYANGDSASTLALFHAHEKKLKERNLWKIYDVRRKLPSIVCSMQSVGVTANEERLGELEVDYQQESERLGRICVNIARGYDYDLELPKSGNNHSLLRFVFGSTCETCEGKGYSNIGGNSVASCSECFGKGRSGNLNLSPLRYSKKTKEPSLDKETLEHWEATLPVKSKGYLFAKSLKEQRRRRTALSYMESYRRFWLPIKGNWFRLHPSLNPTGTDTLRWSSQNPNSQNVSKQEIGDHSLRYAFGPTPDREWWTLDAKNIELRLAAYRAGETEMIDLFERPDDAPYFGSYHLLVFDTLHPKFFAEHGASCKREFASTWYQWIKNGNFAVQYGAVEQSGTADRAYHVQGAQRKIQGRFTKVAALNRRMIEIAEKQGYVETMPDKTVDPDRGYPLLCSRSNWGKILPTIPLNYYVSGTAMWWMGKAMIRVREYLDTLGLNYRMILQVHDELVFDFPKCNRSYGAPLENLSKIREIQRLMERGGDDIGIPTPVSVTYHPDNWGEGVDL